MVIRRLDLAAIETSLRTVQQQYFAINDSLNAERAEFSDIILSNMLAGYRLVDTFVAARTDLFSLGNSRKILELNNLVLYGADNPRRSQRYADQLGTSERYFYEQQAGGIGDLVEFYQRQHFPDVWHRAAMLHVRILAQPQLFIEGNHRTSCLLMSYILVQDGKPPFVLTPHIAKPYFDPSASIGRLKKRSLAIRIKGPRLTRYFARLLKHNADPTHLL
jgi:Fic family protein